MMIRSITTLIFFLLLIGAGATNSAAQSSDISIEIEPPQARPVAHILKACQTSDLELFKKSFSEAVQKKLEGSNMTWEQYLGVYQDVTRQELKDYKLTDLSFSYEGNDKKGAVLTHYQGKTLPGLKVIKEDGKWKVNEN